MRPQWEKFKEKASPGKKCQPKTPSLLSGGVELGNAKREGSGPLSEDSPPDSISDNQNGAGIDDEPSELVQPDLNTTPQARLEQPSRPPIPEHTPSPSLLLIGTLWKDAADSLEKKDREKVDLLLSKQGMEGMTEGCKESSPHDGEDGPPAVVNSILSKAEKIKKAKKGALAPAMDTIITGVLRFKSLGDAAVKFDKSGYAALGWSVLSFGLQVAVNEKGARECAISSIEFITDFMARYAEYEKLFRGQAQPDGKFDHQLVQVYKAVLLYMVALDEYLCLRRPARYTRAFYEPHERAIQKGKDAIVCADAQAQAWLPIVTSRIQKDNFANLLEKPTTQCSPVSLPWTHDYLESCLKSLAFLEMDDRTRDIDPAFEGTCEWLFKHDMYRRWVACDQGLLWIKGKPGSGKSTLLRYALDRVRVSSNNRDRAFVLSFFFHGRGNKLQRTPLGLFRSLLHQLLSRAPDELPDLKAAFQKHYNSFGEPGKGWEWELPELQRLFESAIAKGLENRPIWLFVDALDETGRQNAVELIGKLESMVGRLTATKFPFRICFSCRHYPILELDCNHEICLEHENENAIAAYVNHKLSGFSRRASSVIPTLIISRANGIFLWASLMVERVRAHERDGDGLSRIEDEIRSIPPDLYQLYRDLLRGMTSDSLKLVQWICFATRPLSLEELRWVMVIDADCPFKSLRECQNAGDFPSTPDMVETRLKRLTCGLAEAVGSYKTKVVQFIHQSVRDFFIDQGLSILTGSRKWVAHCIRQSARDLPKTLQDHFIEKSLSALQVSPNMSATLVGFAAVFMLYVDCFIRVHRSLLPHQAFPLPAVLAIVTAFWLHEASIKAAKAKFAVGTAHYRLSRTCLHYLAMEEIALSTSYGRDGLESQFPMLLYATESWVEHVRQSEEHGIFQGDLLGHFLPSKDHFHRWVKFHRIMQLQPFDCPSKGMRMIHMMSAYQLMGPLQMLLQEADKAGTGVDERDGDGRTPLSWAVSRGHEAVVQHLLDRGAQVHAADWMAQTPLYWAVQTGNGAVVQQLLDRAGKLTKADIWGQMPLICAIERGDKAIVQQLLDRGVDVDKGHRVGVTPLCCAIQAGNMTIMRELLDRGANIDNGGQCAQSPLCYAIERGDVVIAPIVQELLDRGANIDKGDRLGVTPLIRAIDRGHKAIVQELLDQGADIETGDEWGRTPLWWAVERGDKAILQLLCDRKDIL